MSFFTTGNRYEKQERLVSSRKDAAIRVVNNLFDSSRAVKKPLRSPRQEIEASPGYAWISKQTEPVFRLPDPLRAMFSSRSE
jgi:hypothetical protein